MGRGRQVARGRSNVYTRKIPCQRTNVSARAHRLLLRSGNVQLGVTPPARWNPRANPLLSEGFAEAARGLGYLPRYVAGEDDAALVLLRSIPIPGLDRWTRRAKVYVDPGDSHFVRELLELLHAQGVAHVRLNDERHGFPQGRRLEVPYVWEVPRHVFLIDVAGRSDTDLITPMRDPVPRNIRKAERARVIVDEIKTEEGLRAFCALMRETSERMRRRHVAAVYPDIFFERVFRYMVPAGQALFLLAHADGVPLAGQMYLVWRDRLTYYHGASTRERLLTTKHGPTAAFWHAIRMTRDSGRAVFDFGGANPTDDSADVHFSITNFKRRWGGRHVAIVTAEATLSPVKVVFQDRLLKPLWDRAHPLYLKLFGRAA